MGLVVIDLEAIAESEVTHEPFRFVAATDVPSAADPAAVRADFPDIGAPGIFPLPQLGYGPAFSRLIEDIRIDLYRACPRRDCLVMGEWLSGGVCPAATTRLCQFLEKTTNHGR